MSLTKIRRSIFSSNSSSQQIDILQREIRKNKRKIIIGRKNHKKTQKNKKLEN